MTTDRTGSPDTESLEVSVQPGAIVAVSGEIDIQSGPQLRDQLPGIIRRHGARLVLDLAGVTFIDCAGPTTLAVGPKPRSPGTVEAYEFAGFGPRPSTALS